MDKKPARAEIREVLWSEVAAVIRSKATQIDAVLAALQSQIERDNDSLAFFNLGFHTMATLRAIATNVEGNISELAWHVRCLHEIDLTFRWIALSSENLKAWIGQALGDERDIVEGFLKIGDSYATEDRLRLEKRLEVVQSVSDRLGLTVARPHSVRSLAEAVGRDAEYQLFYKFYSKFAHPTSWIVNSDPQWTGSAMYRNLLIGLAQVFADRMRLLLMETFRIQETSVVLGAEAVDWRYRSGVADIRPD
jgi:hypothetical protein